MSPLLCPNCNSIAPAEGRYEWAGLALCVQCGRVFRPAPPAKLPADPLKTPPGCRVRRDYFRATYSASMRSRSAWFFVPFVGVWLTFVVRWTFFDLQHPTHFLGTAIGMIFIIFGVVFAVCAVVRVLGRVSVTIEGGIVELFSGVAFIGWRKTISRSAICSIYPARHQAQGTGVNSTGITIEAERTITFGDMLTPPKRDFLLHHLRESLTDPPPDAGASYELLCPSCGTVFSLSAIDLPAAIAACRTCACTFHLADLMDQVQRRADVPAAAPAGIRHTITPDGWELHADCRSLGGYLLILFAAAWNMGVIGFTIVAVHGGACCLLVFPLPLFYLAGYAMCKTALLMVCGHVILRVHNDQAELFHGIGRWGTRQRFRWSTCRTIGPIARDKNTGSMALEFDARSEALNFGEVLPEDRKLYLRQFLLSRVTVQPRRPPHELI